MKQLPIFYVCLLRLVVLFFKIVFCALSACQTCASHDGEDFQAAGNEIHCRDVFNTFSHSTVSGISPSLTLVAEADTCVKMSTPWLQPPADPAQGLFLFFGSRVVFCFLLIM